MVTLLSKYVLKHPIKCFKYTSMVSSEWRAGTSLCSDGRNPLSYSRHDLLNLLNWPHIQLLPTNYATAFLTSGSDAAACNRSLFGYPCNSI